MEIRGERECNDCGAQWSYYETGSITCPDCGSLRSVGLDDLTEHTDNPATLDLSAVKEGIETEPFETVARETTERCSEYVRTRGFTSGGELQPLDATFVAATELKYVAAELARSLAVSDAEELYFLSLLRGAGAGDRPPVAEVPESLAPARGLATATVIDSYRRDLRRHLSENPDDQARSTLGRLTDHKKRLEALDGEVPVENSERLVQAVTDLSHYAAYGEESALATAQERLDGLDV